MDDPLPAPSTGKRRQREDALLQGPRKKAYVRFTVCRALSVSFMILI